MDPKYTISELAKEFGITTRSIRYYEDFGLLSPARKGSTRIYSKRDRTRLRLTLRGKRLGLSLADIKQILDMYDGTPSTNVKQILATLDVIEKKRDELEQQFQDIAAIQKELSLAEERFRTALERINNNNKKKNNNKNCNKNNKAKNRQ